MRFTRRARAPLAAAAAGAVLAGMLQAAAWAQVPEAQPAASKSSTPGTTASSEAVPSTQRDGVLGEGWRTSGDRAWTTTGDAEGFHLLTAKEGDGYSWRTTATLSEPGFDADAWIGNACVTGSGERAVVVYAPRTFTNKPQLMARGGFTAIVDLSSGKVTKLNVQASLSYYNPGCGAGETTVLTQSGGDDKASTRLIKLDTTTGRLSKPVTSKGQLTSAVPGAGGRILAAAGGQVVSVDGSGKKTAVVNTDAVPYRLIPLQDGGVAFLDKKPSSKGKSAKTMTRVKRISADAVAHPLVKKTHPSVLAVGPLTSTGLTRTGGSAYITGAAKLVKGVKLPTVVKDLKNTPKDTVLTTRARGALMPAQWADGKDSRVQSQNVLTARPVNISVKPLHAARAKAVSFTVDPDDRPSEHIAEGQARTPALGVPAT